MQRFLTSTLAALLAVASAPAVAQQQPACPAMPAALPIELSGWTSPTPMAAATSAQEASAAALVIGKAADLKLAPTPDVSYAIRPERPGGSISHGGMAAIKVATAGVYRVAIDSAAWLDLVQDGKTLESVGHGHGPDCSGVRKMVDFKLEPGTYLLQIVGNGAPQVRVLVASVPAA